MNFKSFLLPSLLTRIVFRIIFNIKIKIQPNTTPLLSRGLIKAMSGGMSEFELKKNDPISLLRHTNKSSMKPLLSSESKKKKSHTMVMALDQGESITTSF